MNKKIGYTLAGFAILAAPFTMAGACDNAAQQSGPDPKPSGIKIAKIIGAYQLPDGFRNVVEICDDGGNSSAVTSRGSDLAGGQNGGGLSSSGWLIRLDDPRCKA